MNVLSFTIDHDRMKRGVYVSRVDHVGDNPVTTYDIRMKLPNIEPVMDNPAIHTLEHLMAVYLRSDNSGIAHDVIYVGPMGCRTGMYLVLKGERSSKELVPILKQIFEYILGFSEPIPATTSKECGNYLDHNLALAKWEAAKYYNEVLCNIIDENLFYPENN